MSDLDARIKEVETSISINESLMTAALNPDAAGAVLARLTALHRELDELKTRREGAA